MLPAEDLISHMWTLWSTLTSQHIPRYNMPTVCLHPSTCQPHILTDQLTQSSTLVVHMADGLNLPAMLQTVTRERKVVWDFSPAWTWSVLASCKRQTHAFTLFPHLYPPIRASAVQWVWSKTVVHPVFVREEKSGFAPLHLLVIKLHLPCKDATEIHCHTFHHK